MNKAQVTQEIFNKLKQGLPKVWEGKLSILEMKQNNCHNWKQLEWPGWYFQFKCEEILAQNNFFKIPGPKYGKVEFDGVKNIPWDFKAHTLQTNKSPQKIPTNGWDETSQAILQYGEVGFIIANGSAQFDDMNQTFKKWHDALKGKASDYELKRIQRGATSRKRKTIFTLESIVFAFLNKETIQTCSQFQKGMRNANGKPRKAKVMLDLNNSRIEKIVYPI